MSHKRGIHTFFQWIVDCCFPVFCVVCQSEGYWLCDSCNQIEFLPYVGQIDTDNSLLAGRYSLISLDHPGMRQLLHYYKYDCVSSIETYFFSYIFEFFSSAALPFDFLCDVVVPVPLHKKRLLERGFNQADVLARQISLHVSWPVCYCLLRKKETGNLARLSRSDRYTVVSDAFCFDKNFLGDICGSNVLLVDDVCTTGATMEACAEVLLAAGAANVFGITLFGHHHK